MRLGMGKSSSQRRIVENYTPDQAAEQASWKTLYKVPFPGKQKKIKQPTKGLKAAPDPFDTKPVSNPSKSL